MSDALTPLRHAYAVEPAGPPPGPGDPGDVEVTLLRQMRAVLDEMPRPTPSLEASAAVRARAAVDPLAAVRAAYDEADAPAPEVERAALRQTREVVDQALRQGPRPRPSADAVAAVLARAAEVSAQPPDALVVDPALAPLATVLGLSAPEAPVAPVETALLDQSLRALDALPPHRPSLHVLAAIRTAAAESSEAVLAAVRGVYDEAPAGAVDAVEAAVLRQSREAVEQAFAARPQPRPPAATVGAVLARAAEASGADPGDAVTEPALAPLATALGLPLAAELATDPVETALLEQSLAALDAQPVARPAAGSVAGALAWASAPAPRRTPDRSPAVPPRARRPVGRWAGVGGLLVAALVAVFVLPRVLVTDSAPAEAVTLAEASPPEADAPPLAVAQAPVAADPSADAPRTASGATSALPASALASALPVAAAVPTRASEPPADRSAPPVTASAPPPATVTLAGASVPSWEVNDDVRTLSLRLQELDRGTAGLAWDTPGEALGTPSAVSATTTPGVRSVREGGAPARARLLPDSTRQQR